MPVRTQLKCVDGKSNSALIAKSEDIAASDGRTKGLAKSQPHETSSHSVLNYTKCLQRIAISRALLLYFAQRPWALAYRPVSVLDRIKIMF